MYTQLAWRNIWRNPRRTAIILTAILIGVAAMIILAALMRGMVGGMVNNAIDNMVGHIKIQHPDYRSDPDISHRLSEVDDILNTLRVVLPETARITRRIRIDGVVSNARETAGIEIVGIYPESEVGMSFIGTAPVEGNPITASDKNGILIGAALAEKFQTGIGKKLVVTTQRGDGDSGARAFRIRGIFHEDMEATEKAYLFISLPAAQRLVQEEDSATEIAVTLARETSGKELDKLVMECRAALKPFHVSVYGWKDLLPAITAYLAMFDLFLLIWFVVIFIAMGFGIVNTVLMAVYERMREFGLLKAIGMRPARIIRMVMGESFFLLLLGCAGGTVFGLGVTCYFAETGIDLGAFSEGTQMWGMSRIILPVINASDILFANAVVLLLGLLVSIYPAIKAARFTPVETMRQN
jgi:ABC-type lipoprotein release transport system permease subunit